MATSSMVPYSNPAGNNQTSPGLAQPGTSVASSTIAPIAPLTNPTAAALQNPLIPATPSVPATTTPGQNNFITSTISGTNNQNNLQNQEEDIYGKGIGTSIFDLLNSMSGTNSTMLQEYEQGLVPQETKAGANLNASLGAAGVGANSSVNAIGQANLQAQETAAIAQESEVLTQNQENLTASILTGQQDAASKEVTSSGWDVLGSVLEGVGSVASDFVGLGGITGGLHIPGMGGGGAGTVPSSGSDSSTGDIDF